MQSIIHKYAMFIVLGLILWFPAAALGLTATADVDRTQVGPGEAVALQITIEGGKGEVDTSAISDFEVMPTGTQHFTQIINGQLSQQVISRFMLMPKKTGDLVIPPLSVVYKGEQTMTQAFQIRVRENSDTGTTQGPFFARASLKDVHTVTGQQTVYIVKLYASKGFTQNSEVKLPGFDGLEAKALKKENVYRETVNGTRYNVNEIRYLIQGETPGTYEISPAVFILRVPVESRRRSNDPFDSFFSDSFVFGTRTKPVRVVSNPVSLKVSPLPDYTGPIPYSGLVGIFQLSASLDKTTMTAGESATLTVIVQGRGNIMDAAMPPLTLPEDRFKIYEDAPQEEIAPTAYGVAGKKIFKRALVPNTAGDVVVGPLSLVYYHVGEGKYKTLSTPPLSLKVLPGAPATLVQSGPDTSSVTGQGGTVGEKQAVVLKNKDILDIQTDLSAIRPEDPLSLAWFLCLVLLPGVGFAGFSGILQYRQREKSVIAAHREKARADLAAAQRAQTGSPEWLSALQSALTAALLAKNGQAGVSLTRAEAREILMGSLGAHDEKPAPSAQTADQVLEVMDILDGARFGGAAMDEKTVNRCLTTVQHVMKTLVVLMCLMPMVSGMPRLGHAATDTTPADPARCFIDGTRAYQAGDYTTAAVQFQAVAAAGIKSSDLFYNLGNTYLKSGDIGRAVLWYERALRLAPGDPDLNFNLEHALTQVTDKVDEGFAIGDILFFWQGLVSLKWLQLMSIATSFIVFTWAGVQRAFKKKVFSGMGILLVLAFCLCLSATGLEAYRLNSEHSAVILKKSVAVRSGTMENATPLFDLHAGTKVRVLSQKQTHFKIRFAKGKVGWIRINDAEII